MKQALGYARLSTLDQSPDLQVDELTAAGCHRVFVDRAGGVQTDRPHLAEVLDPLRPGTPSSSGDSTAWPDPCGTSLLVTTLEEHGVGLCSLHE